MIEVTKSINIEYFNSIEIDVTVDDLEIVKNDTDEVIITLLITNNAEDEINEHLVKSSKYEVILQIKENVLHIYYSKGGMMLLDTDEYIEIIGCNISIPENINYKIIENEED